MSPSYPQYCFTEPIFPILIGGLNSETIILAIDIDGNNLPNIIYGGSSSDSGVISSTNAPNPISAYI